MAQIQFACKQCGHALPVIRKYAFIVCIQCSKKWKKLGTKTLTTIKKTSSLFPIVVKKASGKRDTFAYYFLHQFAESAPISNPIPIVCISPNHPCSFSEFCKLNLKIAIAPQIGCFCWKISLQNNNIMYAWDYKRRTQRIMLWLY